MSKAIGDFTLREINELKKYCEHNCWDCDESNGDDRETLLELDRKCKKENPIGHALCGVDISLLIGDNKEEDILNKKIGIEDEEEREK